MNVTNKIKALLGVVVVASALGIGSNAFAGPYCITSVGNNYIGWMQPVSPCWLNYGGWTAADGSDRLQGNKVAADGSDRLQGNKIAADGSDRLQGNKVAADGSDRLQGNKVAADGSDHLIGNRAA
jgi:hypothetical protein